MPRYPASCLGLEGAVIHRTSDGLYHLNNILDYAAFFLGPWTGRPGYSCWYGTPHVRLDLRRTFIWRVL